MKKVLLGIFAILFITSILFAGASFKVNGLRAHDTNEGIKIEWETETEYNVQFFKIERSNNQSFIDYTELDETITATGSGSYYYYVDESLLKTNDNTFYYRIKIVDNDGTVSRSAIILGTLNNISGLKRTWGSIKAMFR